MHLDHTISLLAAGIYTIGALFIKRAIQGGAGITRILFVNSWIIFLCSLPILFFDTPMYDWSRWWGPLACSIACFLGATFVITAIRSGEVSIQTPLMGTKVPMVAIFSVFLLGTSIPISWWVGAFLTFIAIMILGLPDLLKKQASVAGVVYALLSSACFALADVIAEKEAPLFGESAFIVIMLGMIAIESVFLLPFFRKGLFEIPLKTWKWVFWGAFLMAIQEVAVFWVIAFYGKATVVNILYSTRGLFSILLIWFGSRWFGNVEGKADHRVMARRMLGAILLCVAIVVILATD